MGLREIVLTSALGLGLMGCSSLQTKIPDSSSVKQTKDLAFILNGLEIPYEMNNKNGDRDLLIIGERHVGDRKEAYILLAEIIEKNLKIDKVFAEGVNYGETPEESFTKTAFFCAGPFSFRSLPLSDSGGSIALSKKYKLIGVENFDIYREVSALSELRKRTKEVYDSRIEKNKTAETFFTGLANEAMKKLERYNFGVSIEKTDNETLLAFSESIENLWIRFALKYRNDVFSSIINGNLKSNEVGLFVVGRLHAKPTKDFEYCGSLIDLLSDKKVNIIYVDYKEVLKFYNEITGTKAF